MSGKKYKGDAELQMREAMGWKPWGWGKKKLLMVKITSLTH